MAKGGLSGIKKSQGNNVKDENIKSMIPQNEVKTKEHRLVVDLDEEIYWKFKTVCGMRKKKMKEALADALTKWIESD